MGAPQQRKPNNNNFFTQNIQRYGENFTEFITSRDIQLAAINIFRGIAKGRIDISKFGQYFLNPQFLEPCIEAVSTKLTLYTVSYNGVNCLLSTLSSSGQTVPTDVVTVLDYHKRCMEAYTIILSQLTNIKMTGDLAYLPVLANQLSPYRNNI